MSAEVKDGREGFLRASVLVSGLTSLSRILGLVREQVFAALLGAGFYADAFQVAFTIPNLLRDLFAEGALSAAFVPTYTRALAEGRARAFELASRLLTLLAIVLAVLVLLGLVFTTPLVSLLAPGFREVAGKTEATIVLTRVMMPFLPMVSLAAVAMGMLNAEHRFGTPAFAPAAFNLVTIATALLLWGLGLEMQHVALGWAIGTLIGGVAQFAIQMPGLHELGWRFRPEWAPGDPGIRHIARLMGPAVVGLAAVQINVFVSRIFASHEEGAVSWLTYAFRLLYLPLGIFGVAVGTIAAPGLARKAAAGDHAGLSAGVRQSLRMQALLTVPSTIGLILLAVPIVRLLFERGRFHAADTEATAAALAILSVCLVAYASVKVLAPAFYALDRPRVPFLGSLVAVVGNLIIVAVLHERFGYRGVAAGTMVSLLLNAAVLGVVFERDIGGLRGQGLFGFLARLALAAALMGGAVYGANTALESGLGTASLGARLVTCLLPIVLGMGVYAGAVLALGIAEARALLDILRRRRT